MNANSISTPLRILLVEDSEHDWLAFRRAFQKSQVASEITRYARAEEALERLRADAASFDLVVTDYKLPGVSGLELCQELLEREVPLPLVILTGTGSEHLAVEALKAGVDDYLIKDPDQGYLDLLPVVLPDVVRKHGDRLARQRVEKALRQRNRELALLNRLGQKLTATLDLQQVAEQALQEVTEIIGVEGASVWLWDGEQEDWLVCQATSPHGRQRSPLNLRLRPGQGVVGWVVQNEKSVIVPYAPDDPRFFPGIDEQTGFRTVSLLAVPLWVRGKVIGVLEAVNKRSGDFEEDDLTLLETLAASAAIAIDNARLFEEVQRQATTDELTGVHNRRNLFDLGQREFLRARRFEHTFSAIMLDLDHFKQVNDTYGHAVGDQVLRVVTQRCADNIRTVDILGRYGGEEFAVLLPEAGLEKARQVAERLRRSIAETPVPTDCGSIHITISLGVAGLTPDTPDLASLLDHADSAMYAAKQAGRNRVAVN